MSLDKKCCDLRNEKCDEINGFGFQFSTKDTIFVKIELQEYDSNDKVKASIYEYQTIRALADNNLQIQLNKLTELTLYKSIHNITATTKTNEIKTKTSEAFVNIYISYTNSSFVQFASFNLYDSKCRTCEQERVKGTCEIAGVCYNDGETLLSDSQFVCNPENNDSDWTFVPTPGFLIFFLIHVYL